MKEPNPFKKSSKSLTLKSLRARKKRKKKNRRTVSTLEVAWPFTIPRKTSLEPSKDHLSFWIITGSSETPLRKSWRPTEEVRNPRSVSMRLASWLFPSSDCEASSKPTSAATLTCVLSPRNPWSWRGSFYGVSFIIWSDSFEEFTKKKWSLLNQKVLFWRENKSEQQQPQKKEKKKK